MVPPAFFLNQEDRHGPLRILAEEEWRSIGIQQSLGWEHYEIHGTCYNCVIHAIV